jgi:hypothetical protein
MKRVLDIAVATVAPSAFAQQRIDGMDPASTAPEQFGRIRAADYAKWGPVVKASGFTAE